MRSSRETDHPAGTEGRAVEVDRSSATGLMNSGRRASRDGVVGSEGRERLASESIESSASRLRSPLEASCSSRGQPHCADRDAAMTDLEGLWYPVAKLERVPVGEKLQGGPVSAGEGSGVGRRLTPCASRTIAGSSSISAQSLTGDSILDDSTLLRATSGQLESTSSACRPRQSAVRREWGRATHEGDHGDVLWVLLEDVAHQVEPVQPEQLALDLLRVRHLMR